MNDLPVVDDHHFESLRQLEARSGSEGFLAGLTARWVTRAHHLQTELLEHLEQGELDLAMRTAHTLRGSSSSLGLRRVEAAARDVELAADAGDGVSANAAMPVLIDEISAARQALA